MNVRASFKSGSFGIDLGLAQSLWQSVLNIAGTASVTHIGEIAKCLGLIGSAYKGVQGLLAVIKWIRGRGVRKIEPIGDGLVELYVDDESLTIEEKVLTLLRDYKIGKCLEDVIERPLREEGIDTFAITDAKASTVVLAIEKNEAHYYAAPPPTEEMLDTAEYTANLQVLNLAFADGNKWRFTDGGVAFYATMLDNAFLANVAANREVFAKDDLIRAVVRRTQRVTAEGLKAEFEILQVLEHRGASPKVQLNLPYDSDKPAR